MSAKRRHAGTAPAPPARRTPRERHAPGSASGGGAGVASPGDDATAGGRGLIRALGLTDVILMSVVAVVSLRWIPRAARAGPPALLLWALAWAAFSVPLTIAVCELSRRYPEQGGVYAWTKTAFGRAHAFVCGWCYWVSNLFYFPAVLLFAAANAFGVARSDAPADAAPRWHSIAFVFVFTWILTALNIRGLRAGRWLHNLGSVGVWVPAALLIAAGVTAFDAGSAAALTSWDALPRDITISTLGLWSAMCFAFSGLELVPLMAGEVRRPARTLPGGILIAGVLTTSVYVLGTAAVLVLVAPSSLDERRGILDAVRTAALRFDVAPLATITGLLLAIGAMATTSSWIAGSARLPFAGAVAGTWPPSLARLHARYRSPYLALAVQAAASSLLLAATVVLSESHGGADLQATYDVLVNVTVLIYFVPYLYMFLALWRLRDDAAASGLNPLSTGVVSAAGLVTTAVAVLLTLVPPTGTPNPGGYVLTVLLQTTTVAAVGMVVYRRLPRAGGSAG